MRPKRYMVIALIFIAISIIAYMLNFHNYSLSDKTTDWGAFGNYISMSISVLSATLIYITYNEQKNSNRIDRFEQHLHIMFDTLSEMVKREEKRIEEDYQKILRHFSDPFYDISNYEKKKVEIVCTYYWSQIEATTTIDYKKIFRYLHLTIQYVQKDQILRDEEKEGRINELKCILTEAVRGLYFFWLIQNDHAFLSFCHINGVFPTNELSEDLLCDIIFFVCTGQKPIKQEKKVVNVKNIELEDYSNELFDDTYNRLFVNSAKAPLHDCFES